MIKQKTFDRVLIWGSVLLAAILLVSHGYNDIIVTTRHGINFWDILLDGDFFAFYELNRCESGNWVYAKAQGCAYNILVYVIFALWNLPLYLLERFASLDVMNSVPCLVYAKLLPVLALAVTVVIMKKILETMDVAQKQHNFLLYLYGTSAVVMSVIFLTGQYDVLSLIFQLLGVHAFIKKDDKKFLLWFSIAVCFKYLAAVIFLPLLVLRYKKVTQWIRNLILFVVPWVITKVPFAINGILTSSFRGSGAGGEKMAARLLKKMIVSSHVSDGTINLFIAAYAAILIWCYLQKNKSEEENTRNGILASLLAYAAFFGLMKINPYWPILIAPFVVLAIALAPRHLYLSLILETVGMAASVLTNMIRDPFSYMGRTLETMVWPHILEGTPFKADYSGSMLYQLMLAFYNEPKLPAIVNSVFLTAVVALAIIVYTEKDGYKLQSWPEEAEYRDVLVVRFAVTALVCLLPIIAVFI